MSEEKSKGISLRTKRKGRPAISAPKQISGPIQSTGDVPRSTGGKASFDAPPQRPQAGGKVNLMSTGCVKYDPREVLTAARLLILSNDDILLDSTTSLQTLTPRHPPSHLSRPCQINTPPPITVHEDHLQGEVQD
jgi:hypothetical protein